MNKTTTIPAITAATSATNSGYVKTDFFKKMNIQVNYTGDGVDSAFTLTFYGSVGGTSATRYALGVAPALTGTRDNDGIIVYNQTSSDILYDVAGVHNYIYLDISSVTADIIVTINIIGQEEWK
jgi:hypothetical protein